MNQPGTASAGNHRLPRSRLARAGKPGPDVARLALFVSAAAALIALGASVFATVRPLPAPSEPVPADLPSLTAMQPTDARPLGLVPRAAGVLADMHVFSTSRSPLGVTPASDVEAQASDTISASEDPPREEERPDALPVAGSGGEPVFVEVDAPEDLSAEAKQSLDTIALRGIFTRADGGLTALLSFVHRPRDPASPIDSGEPFVVPRASTDNREPLEWRLVAIDDVRNRVLLRHAGYTVAVALFGGAPDDASPFRIAGESAVLEDNDTPIPLPTERVAEDGTVVVERDPRDVMRQLREAGNEADIEDIFRLMAIDIAVSRAEGTADAEDGG